MKNKIKRIFFNKVNLLLIIPIILYILFGSFHITKFVTTDEQYWVYDRIPKYWSGVKKLKAKNTHINDKPGVSLAIFSGSALLFENNPTANHKIEEDKNLDKYKVDYTEKLHLYFRLPIFLLIGILSIFIFWIIKKVTENEWIALWSTSLILLYPILLGISRIVNPDALLWAFVFSAAMSYFGVIKYNEKKYIFLTILFTGMALLTKYVGNILFPFFIATMLLHYFFNFEEKFKNNQNDSIKYFKKQLVSILLIFIGSSLLFCILMPAAIFKPKFIYQGTLGAPGFDMIFPSILAMLIIMLFDVVALKGKIIHKIFGFLNKIKGGIIKSINGIVFGFLLLTFVNWILHHKIIDLTRIPISTRSKELFIDGTNFFEKIILDLFPFIFTMTPIVFLFLMFILIVILYKKNHPYLFYVTSISSLMIMFFVGAAMAGILFSPRYDMILFPFTAFLAAIGIYELYQRKSIQRFIKPATISLLLVFIASLSLWFSKPFYYNYASSLLPQEYTTNNTWGFGGYEAAQYLNSLPDVEDITVWVDYRGTCEFFKGNCIRDIKFDEEKHKINYYVLTRRGQSRYNFRHINNLQTLGIEPSWELLIGDRPENFIKIFKNKN